MIPLTENRAVLHPASALTKAEKEALITIAFYKNQRQRHGFVEAGKKRFARSTVEQLKRHELLRGDVPSLAPTDGGMLAIDRLKGVRS
jgi:hypothetical protein